MKTDKNGYLLIDEKEKQLAYDYCEGYKDFLNNGKTERECVETAVRLAEAAGFKALSSKKTLKAGDKVYAVNKNKEFIAVIVGSEPISSGIHIVGGHIDSPRLDLKQNPIYESDEIAYFKTHYYGGVKKYQWVTIPLAIHGVIVKKGGETVRVKIGEEGDDVTFVITDLLPHLAGEQMSKNANSFIDGENLNLMIGSVPVNDDEGDKVKRAVLKILEEKYAISEEDFVSAELEIVPAFCAKDSGFDRSLIASYGHDDRVCSYPALTALLSAKKCKKTGLCLLSDKEEVGSMGNTGAKSYFMRLVLFEIMEKTGEGGNEINFLRAMDKSRCLSSDVIAAVDPMYASVHEKNNAGRLNYGIALSKYVGSRGKSGSNDASAEMVGYVRDLFTEAGVLWQTSELGKVDAGGGGTIAQYVANLGPETLDCGVPMLSMHSPYEIAAKLDIYMSYKGFKAFFEAL